MEPSNKIAGSGARYANSAAGTDTSVIVESLANPASTLTNFAETGTHLNQSAKSSEERSYGLTSWLRRMLKSSLGYSASCESEVFGEDSNDGFESSEVSDSSVRDAALAGDEDDSCDSWAFADLKCPAGLAFDRRILLGRS